jgi:hypothetical protein
MTYEMADITTGTVQHTGSAKDLSGVISAAKKQAKKLGLRQYTLRFISADEDGHKHMLAGPSRCIFQD